MATPAPLLLFDLGGVLLENGTFDALNRLMPRPLALPALRQRWLDSRAIRRFESGRAAPAEFFRDFIAEWELRLTPDQFRAEFLSWPSRFFDGAEAMLARLRKRHPIACLSNSNELHWAKFGAFDGYFDRTFSSHLIGMMKPDAELFEYVIAALDRAPGQIVFFDDSEANVEMAARLGMHAHRVEGIGAIDAIVARHRESQPR